MRCRPAGPVPSRHPGRRGAAIRGPACRGLCGLGRQGWAPAQGRGDNVGPPDRRQESCTETAGIGCIIVDVHGRRYRHGAGRRHGAADTPCAASDLGADFEELEAYGGACGFGEASACERDASERGEQDIGHGGEPEAELVGAHGGCGGAVGEEVELAFLDAVLHLASGAVELFVEDPPVDDGPAQRGDDEARVGAAREPLRLADPRLRRGRLGAGATGSSGFDSGTR